LFNSVVEVLHFSSLAFLKIYSVFVPVPPLLGMRFVNCYCDYIFGVPHQNYGYVTGIYGSQASQ